MYLCLYPLYAYNTNTFCVPEFERCDVQNSIILYIIIFENDECIQLYMYLIYKFKYFGIRYYTILPFTI